MRVFWTKLVGVAIVVVLLFVYQSQAHSLSKERQLLTEKEQEITEEQKKTEEPQFKDGVYSGTGTGYSGELSVEVTVNSGKITDIEITKTSDDKAYLEKAMNLVDEIIDKQSTDLDAVSGATYSSDGILEAVENALMGNDK